MRADGTRYFGAFVNNKKTGAGIEYKNKKWLVRIKDPRGDYFSIDESISTTLEYYSKDSNSKIKFGLGIFKVESLGVPPK